MKLPLQKKLVKTGKCTQPLQTPKYHHSPPPPKPGVAGPQIHHKMNPKTNPMYARRSSEPPTGVPPKKRSHVKTVKPRIQRDPLPTASFSTHNTSDVVPFAPFVFASTAINLMDLLPCSWCNDSGACVTAMILTCFCGCIGCHDLGVVVVVLV